MALTYDLTECNLEKEWQEQNWDAIKDMIFLTMTIDVGHIKADNLELIEKRLRIASIVISLPVHVVIPILPKLVGLRTNVITTKDAEFNKKMIHLLEYEAKRQMQIAKREKEKVN